MFGTIGRDDVKEQHMHWWDGHVCRIGKMIESIVDTHVWTQSDDYVYWRDSLEEISGFGGNGAQIYDKRGVSAGKLHDELGWSCAANILVADHTTGIHKGASFWVGVNRSDLIGAGYTGTDIVMFYNSLDFKGMIIEWLARGVKVFYCIQRVGDLVISPPGNGSLHFVISVGDLIQVTINHGFTTHGYAKCIDAWAHVKQEVYYNSGLATRHVISSKRMHEAYPSQRCFM